MGHQVYCSLKKYSEYISYINLYDMNGNLEHRKQTIVTTLKNVAKKNNIKIELINTNVLDRVRLNI